MASRQSTARKPKSQPKNNQNVDQWHEERYGQYRDKLSADQLKQIVEDVCGKNYDDVAAAALCLLMDEFERAQFDRMEVASITITVSESAFKYTTKHADAGRAMVVAMRRELAKTEAVN